MLQQVNETPWWSAPVFVLHFDIEIALVFNNNGILQRKGVYVVVQLKMVLNIEKVVICSINYSICCGHRVLQIFPEKK